MIYKVTFEKTMWVRADDKAEAEEKAYDEDFILCDEIVISVRRSSLREAGKILRGGVENDNT